MVKPKCEWRPFLHLLHLKLRRTNAWLAFSQHQHHDTNNRILTLTEHTYRDRQQNINPNRAHLETDNRILTLTEHT